MSRHTPLRVAFRRPWPGTKRGLKLWFVALIIGLKGVGYLSGPLPQTTQEALRLFTDRLHVPLTVCAWAIIGVALVSIWCSYCHKGRDRYGYGILTGFCGLWAVAYLSSPLFFGGPWTAVQGGLTWVAIGTFLLLCAGDQPDDPARRL